MITPAEGATGAVVGPITNISKPCTGQNAESYQAVAPSNHADVYEVWSGCSGVGFARSTNGGRTFGAPVTVPGSGGASPWDPTMAAGPDGTVYVVSMVAAGSQAQSYPVVATSFNYGATFTQLTDLVPPLADNWGDLPSVAVAPDGTVYVAWDYGPNLDAVHLLCSRGGSCSFSSGDLNMVMQASTDEARTFGAMVPISPGYPWSGADLASVVVGPSGQVDVLYQDYPTNPVTHRLSPALNYFTSSTDRGAHWSSPVVLGAHAGRVSTAEWWNDGNLGIDSAGNLYATWDTQGRAAGTRHTDIGWLSYSTDGGVHWSSPVQGPPNESDVPHIMAVTGTGAGTAVVGWLSDSSPHGYALYVRPFSITGGWLAAPTRISQAYGRRTVWPGDSFGLSALAPDELVTSWGSAPSTQGRTAAIYSARVSVEPG
ncbi:MAG TPA: sialidase family protein [Acidimicrobiales bacterium]|nr:sialidase family protein [Acidimicrobiales bacterium]